MSWALFVDESGQDQRESPYEVLAGIAIEDRRIWPLIKQLASAQQTNFGMRLFEAYGKEVKAKELLKKKTYRLASQGPPFSVGDRTRLTRKILEDGTAPTRDQLTALGQAKLDYCAHALELVLGHGGKVFATMVPRAAPRPPNGDAMRKDYAFFLERFYHFLNGFSDDPMGFLIFDEFDKAASHVLLGQISRYFERTGNGRRRSRLIVPEPLFVHSDLTTMVQMTDIVAYVISWGLRMGRMPASPRPELEQLVTIVQRLRYSGRTESGHARWGIKEIKDLRPAEQRH